MFIIGIIGASVGGVMIMGDPGPGPEQPDPGWVVPVAFTTWALVLIGAGLLLASPIQQLRARQARARLHATESSQTP
jgi:hypothetical protein